MPKILIADDNRQIMSVLSDYAKKDGYVVITAYDGLEAIHKYENENPDVILLDVMMPHKDGFAVCKEIRKTSNVPIIMVTARGEDYEKIIGLDIGADDYITKPFSPREVMARVRAIMRRISQDSGKSEHLFKFDGLNINLDNYVVTINNEIINLTKKETEILWTLATNKNKVFSRDSLLNSVWGYDYFGDNRTVDSHIKRLRAKLDEYEHKTWDIKTIWGVGYKFEGLTDVQK